MATAARKFTSTNEEFEVDEILDKRVFDEENQVQYKVKWKNYDYRHSSWEPAENLITCWDLLQEFEKKERMGKSSSNTLATARKSSPTAKKRSASPARTSTASRKSAPTTSAAVKSKRSSSRSRNRSPSRKVLEARVGSKKKSPSPSPNRKISPSKTKSPKSPSRSQKSIRSSPKNNNHAESKIYSTIISGANASPTLASKSKISTTNSSSNDMSFCQMVNATKTKGISLLSELFSPKTTNKQPQTTTKSSRNIFSKITDFFRPKRKIVRGSFFAASPATKHRSSSSSCIFSRSTLNFTNLFYLLFFFLLIFTLYLSYVNLRVLSKRMHEFNMYAQERIDEVSDQMLTMYDEWKYGDNH